MATPAEPKQTQTANSTENKSSLSPKTSPLFIALLCVFSTLIGALGYRYYGLATSNSTNEMQNKEITETPKTSYAQPSPTPITLHAGKGDYTVSHPKSNGPTIQRVIFDPLDAKKGEKVKFSAVIIDPVNDAKVVGSLDADSKQIELVFTKDGMEKNSQIWSTELVLTDSVLYHYILTVSATNSKGTTIVKVSPRS